MPQIAARTTGEMIRELSSGLVQNRRQQGKHQQGGEHEVGLGAAVGQQHEVAEALGGADPLADHRRSEEHTSELQSLMRISYDVFCLKKKNNERRGQLVTYANNNA